MAYKIAQGDQRKIPFELKLNGATLTPYELSELEVCATDQAFRKLMSTGDVVFDDVTGQWIFRLTQDETFALEPGTYFVQARPEFLDGTIIMTSIGSIEVADANSEAVI